jgi:L-asparagine transporter-like permease
MFKTVTIVALVILVLLLLYYYYSKPTVSKPVAEHMLMQALFPGGRKP